MPDEITECPLCASDAVRWRHESHEPRHQRERLDGRVIVPACRRSPLRIVLDPFLGSGSTGMAAVAEGFDFIGCDLDERHVAISEGRIRNVAPLLVTVEVHGALESTK